MSKNLEIEMSFKCLDCNINTNKIGEYYMINFKLWNKINPKDDGMICVGCVEKRLGRKLKRNDFTICPLNENYADMSKRLLDRVLRKG